MRFFGTDPNVLHQALEDLRVAENELALEKTRRVSAETRLEDAKRTIASLEARLADAEQARDEAVRGQIKSLDMIASKALQSKTDQAPPTQEQLKALSVLGKQRVNPAKQAEIGAISAEIERERALRRAAKETSNPCKS